MLAVVIELVAVYVRYKFGHWIGGPVLGHLLGWGPIVWSVVTVVTGRGGGFLSQYEFGARPASRRERAVVDPQVHALVDGNRTKGPTAWYVVDLPEVNAWVTGSTLYLSRAVIQSSHLRAIIAHELGHLNSFDGRLTLALRRMVFPGVLQLFVWRMRYQQFRAQAQTQPGAGGMVVQPRPVLAVGCFAGVLLSLFWLWLSLLAGGISSIILAIPLAAYWREHEYEADRYAAYLGEGRGLSAALDDVAAPIDFATPWLQFSQASHPPTELRIDRLEQYVEARNEREIAAVRAPLPRDRVALLGSTGFFGALGMAFVLVCGMLGFAGQAAGSGIAAIGRDFRQRLTTSAEQGLERAGGAVITGAAEAAGFPIARATPTQTPEERAANQASQELYGVPGPTPTVGLNDPTIVSASGIQCGSRYAITGSEPLRLAQEPSSTSRKPGLVQPSTTVVAKCNTESWPDGWILLGWDDGKTNGWLGWLSDSEAQQRLRLLP